MKLTETRKWILIVYIICTLLTCIYVPWKKVLLGTPKNNAIFLNMNKSWAGEYSFVWSAPRIKTEYKDRLFGITGASGIDSTRLFVEIFILTLSSILIFLLEGKINNNKMGDKENKFTIYKNAVEEFGGFPKDEKILSKIANILNTEPIDNIAVGKVTNVFWKELSENERALTIIAAKYLREVSELVGLPRCLTEKNKSYENSCV